MDNIDLLAREVEEKIQQSKRILDSAKFEEGKKIRRQKKYGVNAPEVLDSGV